ncbi:MAG: hypothetical protein ACKVW3_13050 [Phycisphaerales bacterium]
MKLSTDAKITLGTALTVVSISISATWWFSQQLSGLKSEITFISERMGRNENDLASAKTALYSMAAASEQALRMALENPGLRVPDPRDPNRIIEVRPRP